MQATESKNKQFFNKMRPWSNKYNQNWIGYIMNNALNLT